MKEMITTCETMADDAIQYTTDYVKELIKSKNVSFQQLAEPGDIHHYFTEVTSNMYYPVSIKYDPSSGEKTVTKKCVGKIYGRGMHTDLLKQILRKVSSWYYDEYQEKEMKIKPTYTKSMVEVLKELKKVAWNIAADDVPLFFKSLENTAKVMNGENPTIENQKSYWLVSPVKGGGKTTLTNAIFDGFSNDGYKCKMLGMPEKDWPDLRPFSNCHLAVVNDVSKAPDYDVFKALTRRELFDSLIRCVGKVPTTPRAVIWGSGNYSAPYETDRGCIKINTCNASIENMNTPYLQTILKNAKTADLSGISIFSINTVPVNIIKNENKQTEATPAIFSKIREIKGSELLVNLVRSYCDNALEDEKESLKNISLAKLRKVSMVSLSDSQMSLVSKILFSLRETSSEIKLIGKPAGDYKYNKWDLSVFLNIDFDIFESEDNEVYSVEDEIKANQAAWDKLIEFFENNPAPNPNNEDEDFDFDKIINDSNLFDNTEKAETFDYVEPNLVAYEDVNTAGVFTDDPKTKDFQFETINPVKTTTFAEDFDIPREEATEDQLIPHVKERKDANVCSMRNFLFECDENSLKEQVERASFLYKNNVVNRVVFSGNKSLHCRITVNQEPESIEHYKWLWHKLNEKYFSIVKADNACINPSRLTRKPNGVRNVNGKKVVQKCLVDNPSIIVDITGWREEWEKNKRLEELKKDMFGNHSFRRLTPQNENIIDELERVEPKYGERETWQRAWSLATNDGNLSYQEAASATSFIMSLGFTAEDCYNQIEYGKWNFTKSYLESMENRLEN